MGASSLVLGWLATVLIFGVMVGVLRVPRLRQHQMMLIIGFCGAWGAIMALTFRSTDETSTVGAVIAAGLSATVAAVTFIALGERLKREAGER